MTKKLLMGNEAMAHAALEAGVAVVAGYPGTPSSEIVETIARQRARGAAHGVHVEWSANEKVALELLFGASLAGKRCLFTSKQMGLNVASDALMSLNYVGVRGGLVLVVADDPGPISSQTEQDTRRFAAFAKVPVLDPSSPEQAFAMVKAAFDLSERFHTPVIVRPTTRVDHASTFIDVAEETTARVSLVASALPTTGADMPAVDPGKTAAHGGGFAHDPSRWVIFPQRAYEAHGEINERLKYIASTFSNEEPFQQFNAIFNSAPEDEAPQTREEAIARAQASRRSAAESGRIAGPSFGILASGISVAYAREALDAVAKRAKTAGVPMPTYRFMQVGTPYPFPDDAVTAFTRGLSDVLVLEELDHVIEDSLLRLVGRRHTPLTVHGKLTDEARDRGENDVDDVIARIERFLGLTGRLSLARARTGEIPGLDATSTTIRLGPVAEASLPARPPVLCAGCPHRGTFYAVKQALGDTPAVLCGDIGCYTLGNAAPLDAVDTCLCMGGGITMAQGIAVADPGKKAIAYVGDSTFFASGMAGIANAAYNGHDITVIVLDNATTAMTGAQPHPGTGDTLMGSRSEPLDIESVLAANGFTRVFHANPFDTDASIVAVRAAVSHKGPAAVVFEGACAQLVPAGAPVEIITESCTGCKNCIATIGCPAIGFNTHISGPRSGDRGQATIDEALCVGCGLCLQVCPAHAIVPGAAEDVYRNASVSQEMPAASSAGLGVEPLQGTTLAPYITVTDMPPIATQSMGLAGSGALAVEEALDATGVIDLSGEISRSGQIGGATAFEQAPIAYEPRPERDFARRTAPAERDFAPDQDPEPAPEAGAELAFGHEPDSASVPTSDSGRDAAANKPSSIPDFGIIAEFEDFDDFDEYAGTKGADDD